MHEYYSTQYSMNITASNKCMNIRTSNACVKSKKYVNPPMALWAEPLWDPLGPHGPGPCGLPWALVGWPLWAVGFTGPSRLWAGPLWAPMGPCGPASWWAGALWAPLGRLWARPLRAPLGCFGPGPCQPPWVGSYWALMGKALLASLGPHGQAQSPPPQKQYE